MTALHMTRGYRLLTTSRKKTYRQQPGYVCIHLREVELHLECVIATNVNERVQHALLLTTESGDHFVTFSKS